jgi:branched-chain amino acid transport system permease protein
VQQLLAAVINGVTLGAVYALIALSYTMVYGVLRLINFAFASLFTIGAYGAIYLAILLGVSPNGNAYSIPMALALVGAGLVVAMLTAGLLGVGVERIAYRPLRHSRSILAPLISAIGMSFVLGNGLQLIAGTDPKFFPSVLQDVVTVGGIRLTGIQLLVLPASLVLMGALYVFVTRTSIGLKIQATSENVETAQLMGISVDRVIILVFFIGSALGGAAGLFYTMYYGVATTGMGYVPSIKAFTAAILGGIGNIPGAMLGGLLLGLVESLISTYISPITGGALGPNYQDVFVFLILIGFLALRPQGLLGERLRTK